MQETPYIVESILKFNFTPEQIFEQYQVVQDEEFELANVTDGSSITLEYIQDVQMVLDKIKNREYERNSEEDDI